ncbi:putative membrane protein [Sporosarcina luteola]|nr:putative membrane protein [Sporosarcina luteola]
MQNQQSMSLKEWIITIILLFLPIANLVMLIIWATDKADPRNNFAKAYLIVTACAIALMILIYIVIIFIFFTMGVYIGFLE